MKKKLVVLSLIPLLLSSCGKNENAISVFMNAELLVDTSASFIDVDENDLIEMMKHEFSFILYQYSKTCTHCEDSSKNFENYFKKYRYTIYRYTIGSRAYSKLNEYDNIAFPDIATTPKVMIFEKGKYTDIVNASKLVESHLFNSAINSFVKPNTYVYNILSMKAYQNLYEKNQDMKFYLYNPYDEESLVLYHEVYNSEKKEKIGLIDEAHAEKALVEHMKSL